MHQSNHNLELLSKLEHLLPKAFVEAVRRQEQVGDKMPSLDRSVIQRGMVDESVVLRELAQILGVPYIDDARALVDSADRDAIALLSPSYVASKVVLPCGKTDGKLGLAMADPANAELRAELAFHLGASLGIVASPTSVIRQALDLLAIAPEAKEQAHPAPRATDPQVAEAEGPVVAFVQEKLADAVAQGASDIHWESSAEGFTVRYRINGILVPQTRGSDLDCQKVFARLKVMSSLNVSERRLPQDGRIRTLIAGRPIDFRVSSLPTQLGESIVCRILDPQSLRLGWDELGFEQTLAQQVRAIIEKPNGLFLVTGPTGSGKTTTLYTAIAHLNTAQRKIVTVEDPVEYQLAGVQQTQIHEEIGLTFARVLRSVLRHDPNVILIGEIRDEETAQIACRAAQVGRLVLSTLHTSSARGALTRLVDLGVPDYLVKDVLIGALGQELVTADCASCMGEGCRACGYTGIAKRALKAELELSF